MPTRSEAQSTQIPLLTVVDSAGQRTELRNATILVYSNRGVVRGSSHQDFSGLLTSPPVTLPPGVHVRPTLIPWSDIARISFDSVLGSGSDAHPIATVTRRDGRAQAVFLWTEGYSNEMIPSWPRWYLLRGQLQVDGQLTDVELYAQSHGTLILGPLSQAHSTTSK